VTEMPSPPHPDMQKLSDSSADLYEAIATLEYTGRTVSRSQLAAATGLSDAAVAENLRLLLEHDFVRERAGAPEPVYVPARRGWSAVPSQATGKPLGSGREPEASTGASPSSEQGQTAGGFDDDDRQPADSGRDETGQSSGAGASLTADSGARVAASAARAPVSWSDGGSIAVISWSTADGQAFQREVANQQEAARLLQSIEDDDQLALVSAQVRRVGIGPDS
jgi:DNA-binding transcriptional MocR family regulator